MRPERSDNSPAADSAAQTPGWMDFWFKPVDPIGFHAVRALAGLLLLYFLIGYIGRQTEFFGYNGWLSQDAYREARRTESEPGVPDPRPPVARWSPAFLSTSPEAVNALYYGSLAAVALFTLGIAPRITAPLAWLAAVSFTSNPVLSVYGGDSLLLMLTFYLMIGY